jgi:hypothetical protein
LHRNYKKISNEKDFVIDWCLVVAFVVSAVAGIGLHYAGQGTDVEVWHHWARVHVLSSILF